MSDQYANAVGFEHEGRRYLDCWIETTVRHPGGTNVDGLYIAGHYPDYAAAKRALNTLQDKHPKSFSLIILLPDTPWNRSHDNPWTGS